MEGDHYIEDPKIEQEWYGKPFTIFQIKAEQPRDPTNQVNTRYYDLSQKECVKENRGVPQYLYTIYNFCMWIPSVQKWNTHSQYPS